MKAIFVHGAHSTPVSFNYLAPTSGPDAWCERVDFSYNANDDIDRTSEKLEKLVRAHGPIPLIGHSLGGVLCADVSLRLPESATKVITISSPLGGVKAADLLKWITPNSYFFDNVSTTAPIVRRLAAGAAVPTLSIIGFRAGLPLVRNANDGVVSQQSQQAFKGAKQLKFKLNHFEILLDPRVKIALQDFLR